MPDSILLQPVDGPVRGTIRPPGSKSLTNRALVVAALADGRSRLTNVLESTDTRVMVDGLQRLGIDVRHDRDASTAEVDGCAGRPSADSAELWLENSGTSIRFLTAVCTLGRGEFRLDGNARMRQRPIRDLVDALNALGADVDCETGAPPVQVRADGLPGGSASVAGGTSSQYLSALLMAAPCAQSPVELHIEGELVSRPYVEMTRAVMDRFGASVENEAPNRYRIEPQTYRARDYPIEPDASAAGYFFAAAAITGGSVTVEGLSAESLQGDVAFVDVLERMGCRIERRDDEITVHGGPLQGIDVDMNAISDTVQTLAAVAPFADGPTRIRNVAHVRHKETDRLAAVATELQRLGIAAEESSDGLRIEPGPIRPATVHTYDDHRMAMSFALLGLRVEGIRIADPRCTEKTYPRFFEDLERLCRSAR